MPSNGDDKPCPHCGRDGELHGPALKLNNNLLEVLAEFRKGQSDFQQIIRDNGTLRRDNEILCKAIYDWGIAMETKHSFLISQQNMHHSNVQTVIEKNLLQANERHDKIVNLVIQRATDTASDAKDEAAKAAKAANRAAAAAKRAEDKTGPHPLLDEHGHPTHPTHLPRIAEQEEKDAAGGAAGVLGKANAFVRLWDRMGRNGHASQVLLIVFVIAAGLVAAMLFGVWLKAKAPSPTFEAPREHHEPRLQTPELKLETPMLEPHKGP